MNVTYMNISVAFFLLSWFFARLFWQAVKESYSTNSPRRHHSRSRAGIFYIRDRCGPFRNQQHLLQGI